jgi:hypothetical protein
MLPSELFSKEGTWIQHHAAKNRHGEGVPSTHPSACCWCMSGGIRHCFSVQEMDIQPVYDAVSKAIGGVAITRWTDQLGRTREEVVAAFKKAGY